MERTLRLLLVILLVMPSSHVVDATAINARTALIQGQRSSILTNSSQNSVVSADIPQSLDLTNGNLLGLSNGIGPYNTLGLHLGDGESRRTYDSVEARLFRNFKQANGEMRYVRPISQNSTGETRINVSLSLLKINDMVAKDEKLTTTVRLKVEWDDYRLSWNKTNYGNLDVIHLPLNMLWMPELEIMNGYRFTHIDISEHKAKVSSNGTVSISRVMHLATSCTLNLTLYPYDDQTCDINIGSWNWNAEELLFVNDGLSVDNFELSTLWALIGTWNKSHILRNKAESDGYSYVVFTLFLERQSLSYSVHLIWPTILIASLTPLVFFMPGESGETIQLAITLLLTFTVYLFYAASKMPENSSSVPIFGYVLIYLLMLSAFSVLLCVILLIWHYLGDHEKKLPCCIEGFIFDWIRYIVCTDPRTLESPKELQKTTRAMSNPSSPNFRSIPSSSRPKSRNCNTSSYPIRIPARLPEDINMNDCDPGPSSLKIGGNAQITSTQGINDNNNVVDDVIDDAPVSIRTYKNAAKICGRFIGGLYVAVIVICTILGLIIIRNLPSECWKNKDECTPVPDNTINYWQAILRQFHEINLT
ncbi:unnamed protein product [Owenia fusiformis]|uniref:Uncharacterized protein n=1 Tax=Owenia fusiformis TaxID=6347 RepID=A0A8J1TG25_OWEFU|nr:unnamed protein product [Owenia fusiformis]